MSEDVSYFKINYAVSVVDSTQPEGEEKPVFGRIAVATTDPDSISPSGLVDLLESSTLVTREGIDPTEVAFINNPNIKLKVKRILWMIIKNVNEEEYNASTESKDNDNGEEHY